MTSDADGLLARAAQLANVLEREWGEDFGESLAEDDDVARGFALARALAQGWIEPSAVLSQWFDAAEGYLDEMGQELDDDDDE